MKKNILKTLIGLLFFSGLNAQVGIGTSTPSASAVLELNSTNKGFLMNTVSLVSTSSASPLSAHTEGIWVYNTVTAGTAPDNVIPGLYYNDGSKWVLMSINSDMPKIGDIKSSMTNADHNGWYLLNGRSASALSESARINAASLGYTTALPNTADRIIKGKNASEAMAATGGTNSYSLSQANLPNLTLTGTTSTDGAHSHSYTNRGVNYWNYNAGSLATTRTVNTETRTTGSAGDHSHTFSVPSGGTNTPLAQYPKHMVVQYFIYLGK
ncbi:MULTISPECIES: hypothetical protein [unclassified Chryseobacterium]|uniref:hypothetical protein n=1 Tax=unclassified Chryseobacterium TaxID=2593645 RepID=UPI00091DDD21|nr:MULTISPECIES: hypothetical protein [unclassified Chryseobacterium]SHE72074.1 hypothetical protein SAMN02787100_0690 [Chryseobacterium sp. OV279]HCA07539.1 hypothetical protein [Chryseobacterium sp.]